MIPFTVIRAEDPRWGFKCAIDPKYKALGEWLEMELGSGGADVETELFEEIAQVRAGAKDKSIASGDAFSVTARRDTVTIDPLMQPTLKPLTVPVDEFTDAVVRWYDKVDPQIAARLRAISGAWRGRV